VALKDRFSDDFRRLQAQLEHQMENETPGDGIAATPPPAPEPVVGRSMLSSLAQER
jgi:hypothetical protein